MTSFSTGDVSDGKLSRRWRKKDKDKNQDGPGQRGAVDRNPTWGGGQSDDQQRIHVCMCVVCVCGGYSTDGPPLPGETTRWWSGDESRTPYVCVISSNPSSPSVRLPRRSSEGIPYHSIHLCLHAASCWSSVYLLLFVV